MNASSIHAEAQDRRPAPRSAAERAGPAQLASVTARPSLRPHSDRLAQLAAIVNAPAPNRTGLPDALKAGIESLSGQSLDQVRVHRNSPQPAQLNAHAYAQGSDIHVAPGQEKHLPHEAWHVVQQAQGRVRPTLQLREGVPINDDRGLEHEADVMGGKAAQLRAKPADPSALAAQRKGREVMQRVIDISLADSAPTVLPAIPTQGFIGLPPTARRIVHKSGPTSSPADPPGMGVWKGRGYLRDPSKSNKQALTRMHAIRGKFGGPAAANNMFLGTALSNNFSSKSHFKLVEQPLEQFLSGKAAGETRAFDYRVSPNFGPIPAYMATRINNVVPVADRPAFTAWAQLHIPNGFNCSAILYSQKAGVVSATPAHNQHVDTDVGAPPDPTAAPIAPIAPAAHPAAAIPPPLPIPATAAKVPSVKKSARAMASESGALGGLGYGAAAATTGTVLGGAAAWWTGAALTLAGPIGWTALAAGALGAAYGYATAEND